IFKGFSRLSTWLSALPLALSMEAHYRDPANIGKTLPQLNCKKVRIISYSYQHTAFIQAYPQARVKCGVLSPAKRLTRGQALIHHRSTIAYDALHQRPLLYKEAYIAVLIPIQPL
ncbi:hypothetical protein ACK36E_20110, partial [Aeromonas veronii]